MSATAPGTPVADAVITSQGASPVRTDASGRFTIRGSDPATLAVEVTHPGFVTRTTALRLPGDSLAISLVPATFDLAAFEEFAPRAGGLRRWAANPALVVLNTAVDYPSLGGNSYRVTDHALSPDALGCITTGVRDAIGPLTGGHLTFSRVEVAAPQPGSVFRVADTPEGTIVAMAARGLDANGRAGPVTTTGANLYVRGMVLINGDVLPLCSPTAFSVYPHELGHALGYGLANHVRRQPSLMGSPPASGLTSFDRDAIAILYGRPPGNRAPDNDPAGFTVNAAAVAR